MSNFIDLTGQRFGKLTVLEQDTWYIDDSSGKKQSGWLCVCDCGDKLRVRGTCLNTGYTRSCGCYQREQASIKSKGNTYCRISPTASAYTLYYSAIKTGAKRRNYELVLTQDELVEIGSSPCHYCGDVGIFTVAANKYKRMCSKFGWNFSADLHESKIVRLNGIDRVDNLKGYVPGNCVSCCKDCNISKMDRTQEEFLAWAKRLVAHQEQKEAV